MTSSLPKHPVLKPSFLRVWHSSLVTAARLSGAETALGGSAVPVMLASDPSGRGALGQHHHHHDLALWQAGQSVTRLSEACSGKEVLVSHRLHNEEDSSSHLVCVYDSQFDGKIKNPCQCPSTALSQELGCGCGLVGLLAGRLGASRVVFTDCKDEALTDLLRCGGQCEHCIPPSWSVVRDSRDS
jgi:hypothetical protein